MANPSSSSSRAIRTPLTRSFVARRIDGVGEPVQHLAERASPIETGEEAGGGAVQLRRERNPGREAERCGLGPAVGACVADASR